MDIETHNELETKAGIPPEALVTHAEMMRAFEAYKETNDQRLALDAKRSAGRPDIEAWTIGGRQRRDRRRRF